MDGSQNNDDRDRGILSPADREYLKTDRSEYSRQAAHAREEAIRERIQNAILDFHLLLSHYDPSKLATAMSSIENWEKTKEGLAFDGVADGVGFLTAATFFTTAGRINNDPSEPVDYKPILESAVRRAARYHGFALESVDVSVEFDAAEATEVTEEELIELPLRTLRQLYFGGEITEEQLNEAIRAQQESVRLDDIEHRLENGELEAIDHRDLEDLWNDGRLSDEEYLAAVKEWQEWWTEVEKGQLKRGDTPDRSVHGALNVARQKVEIERNREEYRQEMLEEIEGSERVDNTE